MINQWNHRVCRRRLLGCDSNGRGGRRGQLCAIICEILVDLLQRLVAPFLLLFLDLVFDDRNDSLLAFESVDGVIFARGGESRIRVQQDLEDQGWSREYELRRSEKPCGFFVSRTR